MTWGELGVEKDISISVVRGEDDNEEEGSSFNSTGELDESRVPTLQISDSTLSTSGDNPTPGDKDDKKRFHVFVRDFESTDEPVPVSASSSMEGEELICKVFGQPEDELLLKIADKHVLRSNQTLKEQGIQDGTVLEGII